LHRYDEAIAGFEQIASADLQGTALAKYHANLGDASGGSASGSTRSNTSNERVRAFAISAGLGIDETTLEYVAGNSQLIEECVRRNLELNRFQDAFAAGQDGKGGVLGDLQQRLREFREDEPAGVATHAGT
jgi:hypothetical protein